MYIATIDGGTTNSRVYIWQNSVVIAQASRPVGVRNTAIDNNNSKLIDAIRAALNEALEKAEIEESRLDAILASGMLTSNVGILEVPHIPAPASVEDLARSIVSKEIPEIAKLPIWFIPGIKNIADDNISEDNIADMDIMRGEEAEAAGLIDYYSPQGLTVLVLPGSHNKYIFLEENKILGCMTTIAGELLNSLTFDTILADSVGRSFAADFEMEAFLRGVEYGRRFGFGHAAFMTRINGMFAAYSHQQGQNYLLGLLLGDDIQSIKGNKYFALNKAKFIICGKPVMQKAYACLLAAEDWDYTVVPEEKQKALSGYGAVSLAKRRNIL